MTYQTSPEIDFSAIGLMVDVPSNAIPSGGWSNSLNVRCRNGSVQGVNAFADDIVLHPTNSVISGGEAKAVCQFTPAGGSDLVIAYIVKGTDDKGHVIIYDTGGTGNSRWDNITNESADQVFTFDDSHPPQIFVFNELLIVNPGTDAPPQYSNAKVDGGSLQELPNWLYDTQTVVTSVTAGSFVTGTQYTITALSTGGGTATDFTLIGASASTVGIVFTATGAGAGTGTAASSVTSDVSPLIARIVRPFGNRLVAMNILEERATGTADDVYLPTDFLWSSHITTVRSLTAATWSSSDINTAGDAFLTDTPGKILDGGQLGEFFIAYKSDSVVRVRETGDTFVLAFESIFEDDGIYSTRCFANIGNAQHLVVGNYGIYIHDGQSQRQDIAKDLFKDSMYALVQADIKDRTFVFQQTRDKEVWLCLPTGTQVTGTSETIGYWSDNSDELQIVDPDNSLVSPTTGVVKLNGVNIAYTDTSDIGSNTILVLANATSWASSHPDGTAVVYQGATLSQVDPVGCNLAFVYDYDSSKIHKRTIPDITDIFETELNGELKIYAAGYGTKLQTLSDSVLESDGYFERQNDNLTSNGKIKHVNRIEVNSIGNCKLALTGTLNLSDTKVYTDVDFNPTTDHKVDMRTSGRYMNLRVTMDGATNPQLSKLQFELKMMGVR